MSPHVIELMYTDGACDAPRALEALRTDGNGSSQKALYKSLLQRYGDEELHDLVCVGFGPASLAIAVALQDALETGEPSISTRSPKVRFLERQPRFAWHAGMLLPGTKMQITFIKDLATLNNPRSEFTFLNYLHRNGRLGSFTNLGTVHPLRIEYEDYLRWCAGHFEDVVDYNQSVESVDVGRTNPASGKVESFAVKCKDQHTGTLATLRTRHVVVAVGGTPNIPKCLRTAHPRVIHSSQYATSTSKMFPSGTAPRTVAVIGAGQSAAEVFHDIPHRFPGAKSYLLIRGSALRPSDDSPFVNEIFDPGRVDDVYSQDPRIRSEGIELDKGTNYGVVRLELLEAIYSALYSYRIQYRSEDEWPQQVLTHRTVIGLSDLQVKGEPAVRLHIENDSGTYHANRKSRTETLDVDLVVAASGYSRNAHEEMLKGLGHLLPSGDDGTSQWEVERDYRSDSKTERSKVTQASGCKAATRVRTVCLIHCCQFLQHGLEKSLKTSLGHNGHPY